MSTRTAIRPPFAAVATIAVRTSAALIGLVWILVSVGGAANPGFKQYEQYLSALSADGTASPSWGRAALVVTGIGFALLVPGLAAWRPLLGVLTAVAGGAAVAMTVWPMACPVGARFCTSTDPTAGTEIDLAHTSAVLVFATAVVAMLLAGSIQVIAGPARRPVLWPAIPVAVLTMIVGAPWLLEVSGLPQRLLLLSAQVVLVALGTVGAAELHRRHRVLLKAWSATAGGKAVKVTS